MQEITTFIEVELAKLGRGIVATPDEDYHTRRRLPRSIY
jgi:hypothetical protein